jgi:hypothetical protein
METVLLVDGLHGVYVPQQFARKHAAESPRWVGFEEEDLQILLNGPDTEGYWEAWEMVEANARYVDKDGRIWRLWQESDLFAYTGDGEQFT